MTPRASRCGLLVALVGCGTSGGTSVDLPMISPPVRAATPAGLAASTARVAAVDAMLRPSELHDRFFSGSGPTDLMTLLGEIDQRLAGTASAADGAGCLDQAPVAYTITPAGHSVELVAQCYQQFTGATPGQPAFLQFGQREGATSLYVAVGAARLAALVSPIAGTTEHTVDAWYGVGYTNATGCGSTGTFDDCSYGVAELHANPTSHAFEMAVAGIGVGFCGVQFASDGTKLWATGSGDMGSTCNARATACVSASDLSASEGCTPSFALPALGRHAGAGAHAFGESEYPDAPNVTLDGTNPDSLHFGPEAPTAAVGSVNPAA